MEFKGPLETAAIFHGGLLEWKRREKRKRWHLMRREYMQEKKKVVAAIATALAYYIQAEEQAMLALQQQRAAQGPRQLFNPYALAGRTAAMDVRWTWQMRLAR